MTEDTATGEIREDKTSGQWVIFSPARSLRPKDYRKTDAESRDTPGYDPDCPFCPGHREEDLAVIMEIPAPTNPGWWTRTIPNKYPALRPTGNTRRIQRGIYLTMPGVGRHEVIIENPRHDNHLAKTSRVEAEAVIETYHRRLHDLMKNQGLDMAIIFRNHGPKAGTSLIHPHSQIVATDLVPQHIRHLEETAERYHDRWGCCVYCSILDYEQKNGERLVMENDSFMVFVPFAASVPFEMWVVPKIHQADFRSTTDQEKQDLTEALQTILQRLDDKLGDPDYNYVIHTATKHRFHAPHLHWHLRVRPRLTTMAGFEVGSGMNINPNLPEDDAALLRRETGDSQV